MQACTERDWGQEEKGMTEDEMAGWHHWLDGREPEWTLGVGDGQGGLACCSSWGCKESDTTERLNWTEACTHRVKCTCNSEVYIYLYKNIYIYTQGYIHLTVRCACMYTNIHTHTVIWPCNSEMYIEMCINLYTHSVTYMLQSRVCICMYTEYVCIYMYEYTHGVHPCNSEKYTKVTQDRNRGFILV